MNDSVDPASTGARKEVFFGGVDETGARGTRTHLVRERALERERVRFHDELELRADQGLDVQRREAPGGGGGVPRARRILVVF